MDNAAEPIATEPTFKRAALLKKPSPARKFRRVVFFVESRSEASGNGRM